MDGNYKVAFWLNTSKKDSQNRVPIYLRVWSDYDFFNKSTGIKIKVTEWDKKSKKIKGSSEGSVIYNKQLDAFRFKILQVISQNDSLGKPFSIQSIKHQLDGNDTNQITLMRLMEERLAEMKKLVGKDYEPSTIIKYANTKLRMEQFLKYKYKRSDYYLYELNHSFISDWIIYLKSEFGNSNTTCYKHYQRLMTIIHKAINYGIIDKNPFSSYKIRLTKKKIEYLTLEEINKIEQKDFKIERLNIIRDIFIFCCYSGMGYSEVESLTPDNITVGIDSDFWFSIKRKKTKRHYQVEKSVNKTTHAGLN